MILRELEESVIRLDGDSKRILPDYNGHSLSNIPNSILEILSHSSGSGTLSGVHFENVSTENINKVVLFYIDGVSYDFVSARTHDIGFIGRMLRKGVVSPLTAGFPTTTASSCTSLNTGLTPMEHTLLEWELYYHETGALIYTLPFRAVTNKYSKKARDLEPSVLFSGNTVYSRLKNEDVKSYVLVNRNISKGAYSELVFEGSTIVPYSYITDCMIQLRKILERDDEPAYIYVYIESADSVGHTYGPDTEMYSAELESISRIIRFELLDKIDPVFADRIMILFTSDHGQLQIDPKKTAYLNALHGLWDTFEHHLGDHIPPVGSPRDVFLHVSDDRVEEALSKLEAGLVDTAEVMFMEDAVRNGYFGPASPSERFLTRAGNVLILPEESKTVWYRIKGQVPMHLRGLHGGMSREEMVVPFGAARLSHLI